MSNGRPWESVTMCWRCPEGKVYVTVARSSPGGELRRVWLTVGKAGTALYAAGNALGALVKLALDNGVPTEKVVRYLRGISNDDYNKLVHEACSMADALGRALEMDGDTQVKENTA